jgi:hypothetical protein
MVYEARDLLSQRTVHLHIHAASVYTPFDAAMNGMSGPYGSITVKAGSSVDLQISIRDPNFTNSYVPIPLPELALTFVDIGMEDIAGAGQEFVMAGGFSLALQEATTEVLRHESNDRTMFSANAQVTASDVTVNPMAMTQLQKNRAIVLFYSDVHEVNLTIGASNGRTPRGFNIGFFPALLCAPTTDGAEPPANRSMPKLPTLALNAGDRAIEATVGATFQKWFAVKGDTVRVGSPVALTKHPNGMMDLVTSTHDGTVVAAQPLRPGDLVSERVSDNVIAVIGSGRKIAEIAEITHVTQGVGQIPVAMWWMQALCLLGTCGLGGRLLTDHSLTDRNRAEYGGNYAPVATRSLAVARVQVPSRHGDRAESPPRSGLDTMAEPPDGGPARRSSWPAM